MKPPSWREVAARGGSALALSSNNVIPAIIRQSPTGTWRVIRPVVDAEKCTKCGICVTYCPDGVITLGEFSAMVNYDFCKGCGICAYECPAKAIEMEREKA